MNYPFNLGLSKGKNSWVLMRASLTLAVSLLLMATPCYAKTTQPVCFKNERERVSTHVLTTVQKRVLADAKVRSSDECNKPNTQCVYEVSISKDRKIIVWVSYAVVGFTPPVCLYGTGHSMLFVYTLDGQFLDYSHGI
ncbi:MAG TPA: hypothetical protein VFL63_08885 [Rhodanobacteraceae bacterium]|jgi:hypothetical protein|nr:hypothetical protein [Rhodanobacteraceae bacterium]